MSEAATKKKTPAWTPGPWIASFTTENKRTGIGSWHLTHQGPVGVTVVPLLRVRPTNRWAYANAQLIAAAPELYEALQLLTDRVSPDGRDGTCEAFFHEPLKLARAALKKARGEQ